MSTLERKTPGKPFGFPRSARITRGAEIQRIAREGKRIRTEHIEVRVAASPFAHPDEPRSAMRVGLIVPRFKHSAVARNRVKRRLRELVRIHMLPTSIPACVVLRIRPEAYLASFEHLAADIERATKELDRWHRRTIVIEGSA